MGSTLTVIINHLLTLVHEAISTNGKKVNVIMFFTTDVQVTDEGVATGRGSNTEGGSYVPMLQVVVVCTSVLRPPHLYYGLHSWAPTRLALCH